MCHWNKAKVEIDQWWTGPFVHESRYFHTGHERWRRRTEPILFRTPERRKAPGSSAVRVAVGSIWWMPPLPSSPEIPPFSRALYTSFMALRCGKGLISPSLVPRSSLLPRRPREVTPRLTVQVWPSRERLGTRLDFSLIVTQRPE